VTIEEGITKKYLRGKQIRSYSKPFTDARLICPYQINENDFRVLSITDLTKNYPLAYKYLKENQKLLAEREKGRFQNKNWFAFGYPKSMTQFQKHKIIVPDYNNVASYTFDEEGHFFKTGYGIILKNQDPAPLFILGLLNSNLLFWYLKLIGTSLRGGYIRFWTQYIEQLPIRTINFSDPADKARHDKMVALVTQLLDLNKKLQDARLEQEKTALSRQIEATDASIDKMVYELYGLTEEEIKVVEDSAGK